MRFRCLFFACAFLVLGSSELQAQTHPCDATPTTNPQLTSPVRGGFCHTGRDVDGTATTITQFRVYMDGQLVWQGPLSPIGAPTADGRFYFETPPITTARGNHTFVFTAVSADGESAASAPVPFGVVGAPPAAPTNPRAKK